MKDQSNAMGRASLVGYLGIAALSGIALILPGPDLPIHVASEGHSYILPASADVSRAVLSDGRRLEVHGGVGKAYIVDNSSRHEIKLPEIRRFGSVTVMPGGEVLLWGGVDPSGHVLDTGEWFNPATQHFVRTGPLGLPPRAGHTLSVLTDGSLMMVGGWSTDGEVADTPVLWNSTTRKVTSLPATPATSRLGARATLQADGSVDIEGGLDSHGLVVVEALALQQSVDKSSGPGLPGALSSTAISYTFPTKNSQDAPIHGPLVLRFATPVDPSQLNGHTVTLLGPEGAVATQVVGAEGGRLAFVHLPDDLYPGSRYTLFVKGLHTQNGQPIPFTAVGFTTISNNASGVVVAGQGGRPVSGVDQMQEQAPIALSTGDGKGACRDVQLCRTQSFIRDGAWYPGQNNVPNFTGAHWRLNAPYQSLPDTKQQEAALPKGATALIGQVRQIDERPVANVEVSVGDVKARTDAKGIFVLTDLPVGHQELFVDGGAANHGDAHYGRFLVAADIRANTANRMPFVMYLPRVLPRDEVALPAPTTREVVLKHPDMPGLEVHIPAGAVFKDRQGHVLTHIALVPTPVDHAPFPLPDNFPMYFTIQPGDAVMQGLIPSAAQGIRVVYPNYGQQKPGSASDFWVYSMKEGWQMYGQGHVTADAKHLAPDPGVTLSWALGAGASQNNANPPTPQKPDNCSTGEPIDLQTGIMFHEWNDLAINDIVPLTLTRAYSSGDTNSHAFGIGGNANFGIHLYSPDNGASFSTPELVLPCGEGIVFSLVSGSATWPFPAGTVWEHTGTQSAFYGATLQFVYDSTPDAAHWIVTTKGGNQYAFTRHVPNTLSWIQDRYGNQTQLTYNGGLLSQMVSPSGRSITLNYDSGNRVSTAVDNTGRTVGYTYNGAGSLSAVTYQDQTTEQYTYDTNKRMLTMQDRRGNVWVTNQYDTSGRVAKQTYADNTAYQFAYTADGAGSVTRTTVTDPNGNQQLVDFDPISKYPLSVTEAYGTSSARTTSYIREASGLVDAVTDPLGRQTIFAYDNVGNITSVTRLAGTANPVTSKFTYTPDYAQLASVTDPLGHVSSFAYENGCLSKITNALGNRSTIQCNRAGEPIAVTDALGHTTIFLYQGYDLQSITDPLGRTVSYLVDDLGRRIAARDPLGNVTLTQYDLNDRVTTTTDSLNHASAVSYDGNGNPLTVTLPNGAVIAYTYDARNRLVIRTDALHQAESWTYDGMGNPLTHKDRKGQVSESNYDNLNRRYLVTYADGSGIQANYDASNRLTSLTDTASGVINWAYDDLDRVTVETGPLGTVSYAYDVSGRRIGMTAASQAKAIYTYDDADRLTSIVQGSETVQMAYDAANRRTELSLPNGVAVNYSYDAAGELTGINYIQGNGGNLGNLSYTYDGLGRRIGKGGSFSVDSLPSPSIQGSTFDLNSRASSFNGQVLSYDANGNLTGDGTNIYTWNARNQLTQITQGSTVQMSYSYDALGRRTSKTQQGGAPTQFLFDGANTVQEMQGGTINPILVGPGMDARYARNDVTGRTYFLVDALNSTIALTDSAGAVREQYSYDPYGNVTLSDTARGFTNPYQYTGREADSPGLYYYRARYYSPMMASFISEDPITFGGGQMSFYAYAHSNPLNFIDSNGKDPAGAVIGGVIGGIVGYASGVISGDCGENLRHDVEIGFASGFFLGLTDGLSLVGQITADGFIGAGFEADRQWWNGGSVDNWGAVAGAGGLSALGGALSGVLEHSAEDFTGQAASEAWKAASTAVGDAFSGVGSIAESAAEQALENYVRSPLDDPDFRRLEKTFH